MESADMKNFFKNKKIMLGSKLIFFQAVTIVVVLLMLALIAGQLIKSRFTQQSTQEMAELNKRIIEMIDVYNLNLKEHAVSLAKVLVHYGNNEKQGRNISLENIDRFTKITGAVATLFVKQGDDFIRNSTSLRKQDGSRAVGTLLDRNHPGYKKVLAGESYTGPAILFGCNYMTHYEPIKNGGRVTGIHFIGLDFTEGIKHLKEKIRSIRVAKNGYIFIIEGNRSAEKGKAVVHFSEKLENKNLTDLKDNNGNEFIKTMLHDMNGIVKYNLTDESGSGLKYAVFNYYDEWNWIIATSALENDLISEGLIMRNYLFAGFFLVSVLILFVLYGAVRKIITARFNKLNVIVKDLSEGEGDLTVRLDSTDRDEIGVMSASFNRFLDDLEKMIGEILLAGQNLSQAVESINEGNQDLSRRTAVQASTIEEIASTIEEAVATIRKNSENSLEASRSSQEVGDVVTDAKNMSLKAIEIAENGGKIVDKAVESIDEINKSSSKISNILKVINEIAFQTNLLALNAAVEAARAGEQGRGFAVVAGEVRSLAQRSATSANEISDMIKDSIEKVETGTKFVNKSGESLNEIIEAARTTGEALDKVIKAMNKVTRLITEIAAAGEEQRKGMEQTNIAIVEMDTMTQQNAALVEETASAAEKMSSRAKELLDMLHRFKIRQQNASSAGSQQKANGDTNKAIFA